MPTVIDAGSEDLDAKTISENLPQTLREVASALKEAGCSSLEIRLALLALCGVQVSATDLFRLRVLH
ncbi:MAG: hypothetical protein K2H64_01825 [Desulfovibrio sp.]|nr:hypothetical protein [Desulfovibrio sp.]